MSEQPERIWTQAQPTPSKAFCSYSAKPEPIDGFTEYVRADLALPQGPVGWRDFHDWWSTEGHAIDPEPDVSWYDKRRDFAEMAFNAAIPAAPGQPEQPSPQFEFSEPYRLHHRGDWFLLHRNSVLIASFGVKKWGSEEACIEAAWRHAYEPKQPSAAEAARVPECVDPFYPSLIEELAQQVALWKGHAEAEKCPTFSRGDARYIHDLFAAALRSLTQEAE